MSRPDSQQKGIFATWAPRYRQIGLEPRPVTPGSKATKIPSWQKPDSEFDSSILDSWPHKYGSFGIGLRLGTELTCGGILIALDVDDEAFLPLFKNLFGSSLCGRVGARGAAFFVRGTTTILPQKLKTYSGTAAVDVLGKGSFCVLPPTIHPKSKRPYTWLSTPLHDFDLAKLPLIEELR